MQTIYAYYLKLTPAFGYRRERWNTPDGDFIDLDWLDGFPRESKLVVLFHGLEGMFAQSLRCQLDEPAARRRMVWNRAAFSWLRRRDQPIASILSRGGFCRGRLDLTPAQGEAWRSALCGGYFARWQYAFEVARRTGRTGSRCGREGVGCVRARGSPDSRQTVRLRLEERKSMQPIFSGP